jgi:Protein of unknown function DUF262
MLQDLKLYQSSRGLDTILHWSKEGSLEVNPPYQRGDVWGPVRRVNLIKSILQGIPIGTIIINDRLEGWKDTFCFQYAVIDGKQRVTTILDFLQGRLPVPSDWFDPADINHVPYSEMVFADRALAAVTFHDLTLRKQRVIRQKPTSFTFCLLPDIPSERHVFDLVNYGGVPQGESDYEGASDAI